MRPCGVAAIATLVGVLAFSGVARTVRFPGCDWASATVSRSSDAILVRGEDGRQLLRIVSAKPETLGKIAVTLRPDSVEIDGREALAAGGGPFCLYGPAVDPKPLAGRCVIIRTWVEGCSGTQVRCYLEGRRRDVLGKDRHYFTSHVLRMQDAKKPFDYAGILPPSLNELHFRWDVQAQVNGPIRLYSAEIGLSGEVVPHVELPPKGPAELLFSASYEGSPDATTAKGAGKCEQDSGLTYVPGVKGRAVLVRSGTQSILRYPFANNVRSERGTVAMWVKRQWNGKTNGWRYLFAFPSPKGERLGSGQLALWFYDGKLRGDASDDDDTNSMFNIPYDESWHFVALGWHERGLWLWVDGKRVGRRAFANSPVDLALRTPEVLSFCRKPFKSFFVGNCSGGQQADCAIDELRIWSEPLEDAALESIWKAERPYVREQTSPNWAELFGAASANPYEAPAETAAAPGVPVLETVEEIRLDAATVERLVREKRFAANGQLRYGTLGGVPYLEAGMDENDRFALRFTVDPSYPLYCFEIDYPDDAKRTSDIIVQKCKGSVWDGANGADYALQVGYATGDEYSNTGRMKTHRCLYWTQVADVSLQTMTARAGAPAAIAAVRVKRVKDGKLPVAAIREPKPCNGWGRSFCLYYEDPAIEYDFARRWDSPTGFREIIDRTAALMKFTGQNLFAYPGAWYQGLIGGSDGYNPRCHPDDFLTAWYERFDREGLSLVPTINIHDMTVKDGVLNRTALEDGSLHASPLAVHADGLTGDGGTHDSLSGFSFLHPDVQSLLEQTVDALLEQGAPHPSFKGLCLHLTRYNMLWFGDWLSGYNDYVVDAFCREREVHLPESIDRRNPLRGKAYYTWLKAEHWEPWLDWRCDKVTEFWARIARKMAARRPDLKLWFNSFAPPDISNPEFARADYLAYANRGAGLDGRKITAAIPNAILCQTQVPADYRWRYDRDYLKPEFKAVQRDFDTKAGFWSLLDRAGYPWVNQHDRYWEDAVGRRARSDRRRAYGVDWLDECPWRVTTINPSGRHALRHFVGPFRHHDILGLSKGGFLIGTYGMEDVLVPFVQAFRALPPVRMRETGRLGDVVVRQVDFDGHSYFYVVNTAGEPVTLEVSLPSGTTDLVSGLSLSRGKTTVRLDAYELRSFQSGVRGAVLALVGEVP